MRSACLSITVLCTTTLLPFIVGCSMNPFKRGTPSAPAPATGEPAGDDQMRKADQVNPDGGKQGLETRKTAIRLALWHYRSALQEEQRKEKPGSKTVTRLTEKINGAEKGMALADQLMIQLDVDENEKKGDEERRLGEQVPTDGSVRPLQEKRSRYQRALMFYQQALARLGEASPPDSTGSDRLKGKIRAVQQDLPRDQGIVDAEIEAHEREGDEASRKGDQIRAYRGCQDPSVVGESVERDIEGLREKRRQYSLAITSYQSALQAEQLKKQPDPARPARLTGKIAAVQRALAACDQNFNPDEGPTPFQPPTFPRRAAGPGAPGLMDDDLPRVGPY